MSASNARPVSDVRLRFEGYELVGDTELRSSEGRVPLQPQPLRLLAALARRPGEILTRDELRRILWGELHLDHEHGLNFAVRQLRVALGDSPEDPRFVQTVPKVGYRFLPAVEVLGEPAVPPPELQRRPGPRWLWPAIASLAALAAVAAVVFVPRTGEPPRVLVTPVDGAPGFSEDVILELARLPPGRLAVVAPVTAGVATVSQRDGLRVTHVVETRTSGDGLDARLTAAADGRVVWAGRLDRSSPFAAARLAREVSLALRAALPESSRRGGDAALREGWRLLRLGPFEDVERARARFESAARDAPDSAEAHIGLAESLRRLPLPARETSGPWRAAAERAIALDPEDPRGHLSLAGYQLYRERNLRASRASFERALSLGPGMAAVPDAYAAWFSAQGRHEEALSMARRAADLDPLSTSVQIDLGWYLYLARRQTEAAAAFRRAFELEGQAGCLDYALRSRMAAGDWDEARVLALRVMEARSAPPSALAAVRAAADAREAVRQHLRWNLERLETRSVSKDALAIEHAWLGEDGHALGLLEAAFEDGGGWALCFLSVEPAWDRLRPRPEFQSLVARAGIAMR